MVVKSHKESDSVHPVHENTQFFSAILCQPLWKIKIEESCIISLANKDM